MTQSTTEKLKKEFEREFVRKDLGGEDKGKYEWKWFLKEAITVEKMWSFIQKALQEEREKVMEEIKNWALEESENYYEGLIEFLDSLIQKKEKI